MTRQTFYTRYGKRMVDLAIGVSALVLLSPLLITLVLLVRVLLGGPVLFRQVRTGLSKKPFTILKFRTMTNVCDAAGNLLPDSVRLTRFGRFLRATSLDELPELWNVIVGDMSLIGPRPLLPRYDESYTERELKRFELLPGLTGWAQINGRNDLAWDDRLERDVEYVEQCGFWWDVQILLLTLLKVVRRDNVQANPDLSVGYLDEERRQLPASPASAPMPCLEGGKHA